MKSLLLTLLFFIVFSTESQQFEEKEVSVGKIKGTLTIPVSSTKTAILLIAGSGPTDRDGNNALGFTNNGLKMVAHELASEGYAVLRFDKKGVAASQAAVTDPKALRFEDFVEDTRSWIEFLDDKGYRKIIIAGHSQGSLVGILAAQNNTKVDALISLAGPSEDAGEAIIRQLSQQSQELADEAKIKIDSIRNGHTVSKFNPVLASLFNPQVQPFLQSYMAYDPVEEIKKLKIPILIINGSTDLQVRVDDAKTLNESYPKASLLIISEMNHVLKHAAAGDLVANGATYSNPDLPLKEGLMDGMIDFIKNL